MRSRLFDPRNTTLATPLKWKVLCIPTDHKLPSIETPRTILCLGANISQYPWTDGRQIEHTPALMRTINRNTGKKMVNRKLLWRPNKWWIECVKEDITQKLLNKNWKVRVMHRKKTYTVEQSLQRLGVFLILQWCYRKCCHCSKFWQKHFFTVFAKLPLKP